MSNVGPFSTYSPPGVYTSTTTEPVTNQLLGGVRVAFIVGAGKETLSQVNFELVRGSSSSSDTSIFGEDITGRWIVSGENSNPILGLQDGSRIKFKVRNSPIVDGSGRGTVTYEVSTVNVTVDGTVVPVSKVDGANGVITLVSPVSPTSQISVDYYFHRHDTVAVDDVSEQITAGGAVLTSLKAEPYVITSSTSALSLVLNDASTYTISLTSGTRLASDVANDVNSAAIPGLSASVSVDASGVSHLTLSAAGNIRILSGSANASLGFNTGDYTNRNKSFRVFNGPMVDGTDSGTTTTDPTKIVVLVDNLQVIPAAVDGASRLVTLAAAPIQGARVTIQYFWNTYQDTFDYLPNSNIVSVGNVGISPSRRDYVNGADFVVVNEGEQSRIHWGTAFTVVPGLKTGSTDFDSSQVTGLLVDDKVYGTECARYIDPVTNVVSPTKFVLPLQATTGNGRDTPLGTTLYQAVANGRMNLPTNRPDLVVAHVGKNWRDASSRPAVKVLSVESSDSTIVLGSPVPPDSKVFATFWYNRVVDDAYTFQVVTSGPSGVGTYTIASEKTSSKLLGVRFGTKSSLPQTVVWPSGSESITDSFLTGEGSPVPETVTVSFSNALSPATHASFTNAAQEPYDVYAYSKNFGGVVVDGNAPVTVDLSLAYRATLVSDPVASALLFASTDRLVLSIDGVTLAPIDLSAVTTPAQLATAINAVVDADVQVHADGSGTFASTSPNAVASVSTFGSSYLLTLKGRNVKSSVNGLSSLVSVLTPTSGGQTDGSLKCGLMPNQSASGSFSCINQAATAVGSATAPFSISAGFNDTVQLNVDGSDITASLPVGASVPLQDVVTTINDAYIAVASSADIATYTTDVISLSNALRTGFNAHRVSTVFHVVADSTNAIVAPVAVDLASAIVLVNDLKAKFNAHLSQAGVHQLADSVNTVVTPDATNLQSAVVLANDLKVAYNLHLLQLDVHGHSDTTNALASVVAPAVDADTYPILNDLKLKFNAHRIQAGVHLINDVTNSVSSPNAIDNATAFVLANEIKTKFNAHLIAAGVHPVNDTINTITSANATNSPTLIALVTEEQAKYTAHRSQGVGIYFVHGTNDGTNAVSFSVTELVAKTGLGVNAGKLVLTSRTNSVGSSIVFKSTSTASDVLGFSGGVSATRRQPLASDIATALNANASFHALAVADRVVSAGLGGYLNIQSLSTGSTSTISFSAVANSALVSGTKLGITVGVSGDAGESAQSGFSVTSSAGASGSSGTGFPGQTYTDARTGLRFTVLPASSGDYSNGGSFTLIVNETFTVDASVPLRSVPGVEVSVYNTNNMNPGTTAILNTYTKSGNEPAIGDVYYVSYEYAKSDTGAALFRDSSKISVAYGPATPDYPISLAAKLAQLNGAVVLGLKQVPRDADGVVTSGSYVAAIDSLRKSTSGVKPSIIVPLSTDPSVFAYLNQHCYSMSSPRLQGERTAIVGTAVGTTTTGVQSIARGLSSERMIVVYPDSFVVDIEDSSGRITEALVDGSYCAAALAGQATNPSFDVASPLTRRPILGLKRVGRVLDPGEMNSVAVAGVTLIDSSEANTLRVRHGLTTADVRDVILRTPSVIYTIDDVQQMMRAIGDPYVGQKFSGALIKSLETALSGGFSGKIDRGIVAKMVSLVVAPSSDDPTLVQTNSIYVPVFPLEYITAANNVRVRG